MAVIKLPAKQGGSTKQAENYLKKEEKTEVLLMSSKDCDINNFAKDFEITRNIHQKTDGRQHFQIIQSFNPGETTPEQAHEIGKEMLQHDKFKDFQAVCITHKDKEHIHNHIIINSVSYETGMKFHSNKKDLYDWRNYSDKLCLDRNLSIIKNRHQEKGRVISHDMDKYQVLKKGFEGKTKSYVLDTVLAVEKSLENSTNKEQFISEMEKQGYKTNWTEERKNVTFENQEGKKVRLSNLEKTFSDKKYTKEGLNDEFKRLERERRTRDDFKDFSYTRESEYNDNKGLLRVHNELEKGQERLIGSDTKQHELNKQINTKQPGSKRADNRQERGQQENNYPGEPGEQRQNNRLLEQNDRLLEQNDKQTKQLHRTNTIISRESGFDQLPNAENRAERKRERGDDEKENSFTNKANDFINSHDFNFNYIPNREKFSLDDKEEYEDKMKQEKSKYNFVVSQDLIEQARKTNLVDYLQNQGYELKRDNENNYKCEELPGIVVNTDGKWYDFNNDKGGKAIDFVMQQGYSFKDAVVELVNPNESGSIDHMIEKSRIEHIESERMEKNMPLEPFKAPQRASDDRRVFAYLTKSRGISNRVLEPLVKKGLIYQTDKTNNVAFVGKDKNGEVKYCFERSTLSDSNWKGETKGSKKEHSFSIEGNSNKLYLYESPIDLLSHASLHEWKNHLQEAEYKQAHKLSLGGVGSRAFTQYIRDHKEIKEVVLCLDNDKTGIEKSKEIKEKLENRGFKINIEQPKGKDWNIDLVNRREKDLEIKQKRELEQTRSRGMRR